MRSPETEAAILNAAAEILDEFGYAGFTLDRVVERAGSSKPTIYRWWKNKAELIRNVYERAGEATLVVPDTGDLATDLVGHLDSLWNWWSGSRSGDVLLSVISEMRLHPASVREFSDVFLPRRERAMRLIVQRAVARGEILGGSKADAAVSLLTGASWMHLLTQRLDARARLTEYVDLVVAGLKHS